MPAKERFLAPDHVWGAAALVQADFSIFMEKFLDGSNGCCIIQGHRERLSRDLVILR